MCLFVDGLSGVGCCFFFSSRRRHTRCGRDWSSDVCSSDLAPVDGGLAVKLNASAELELVRGVVDLLPRLGEVALDGEAAGADARPCLVLEEPAVREADHHVGAVSVRQDVVEVGRIPRADVERAAALGGAGGGG